MHGGVRPGAASLDNRRLSPVLALPYLRPAHAGTLPRASRLLCAAAARAGLQGSASHRARSSRTAPHLSASTPTRPVARPHAKFWPRRCISSALGRRRTTWRSATPTRSVRSCPTARRLLRVIRWPATITPRPGSRLPHAWLELAGRRVGTHDLVRPGSFTLFAGGSDWRPAAVAASAVHGIAIDVVEAAGSAPWREFAPVGRDGAVLVGPDAHVAWRSGSRPSDPARALSEAVRSVLGRVDAL